VRKIHPQDRVTGLEQGQEKRRNFGLGAAWGLPRCPAGPEQLAVARAIASSSIASNVLTTAVSSRLWASLFGVLLVSTDPWAPSRPRGEVLVAINSRWCCCRSPSPLAIRAAMAGSAAARDWSAAAPCENPSSLQVKALVAHRKERRTQATTENNRGRGRTNPVPDQ